MPLQLSYMATALGRLYAAASLLGPVPDVNRPAPDGSTILHRAAQQDRLDHLVAILAAGGDVHARDRHGRTPIFYAGVDMIEPLPAVGQTSTTSMSRATQCFTRPCAPEVHLELPPGFGRGSIPPSSTRTGYALTN